MNFNITVEGGSAVRLPTAGKYCDRDIVVTATGGGGESADVNIYDPAVNPVVQGTITSSTGQDGNSTARLRTSGYIAIKPNSAYRISTNIDQLFVIQYGADQKPITNSGWKNSPYLFITSSTARYIRMTFSNASSSKIEVSDFEWLKIEPLNTGAEPVVEALTVTANGTYTAPDGVDGYSPITVNVPVPDGYIKPSGTLEVTENGTHDVTEYAFVNVNVNSYDQGYADGYEAGEALLIQGKPTRIENDVVTSIRDSAFYYGSTGTPTYVYFKNAKSIGTSAFKNCRGLKEAYFDSVTSIGKEAFYLCNVLTTLVIRTPSVSTLVAAMTNNKIASGTGYIYVPDELVDSYKTATNWSTHAAQIKPLSELEGST